MALRYPSFDYLAITIESWVRRFLDLREDLESVENSLRREMRRGIHQGLDLGERLERGVEPSIVEVRMGRAEENQRTSGLGKGDVEGGGICESWSFSVNEGQSESCQQSLNWFEGGMWVVGDEDGDVDGACRGERGGVPVAERCEHEGVGES